MNHPVTELHVRRASQQFRCFHFHVGELAQMLADQEADKAEIKRLQAENADLSDALSFTTNAIEPAYSEETDDWELTDVRWRTRIAEMHAEIERLRAKLKAKQKDVDDAIAIMRDLIRERDTYKAARVNAESEIERLQAIVDTLPKCWRLVDDNLVQDVPILPGMELFTLQPLRTLRKQPAILQHLAANVSLTRVSIAHYSGSLVGVLAENCYATREAAERCQLERAES